MGTKRYVRRNRSGNAMTVGIGTAIVEIERALSTSLDASLKANIDALVEVRDSSIHFVRTPLELQKGILEVATASVHNFIHAVRLWFERDLSHYNASLLPVGLVRAPATVTADVLGSGERRLLETLNTLVVADAERDPTGFQVALALNLSFKKAKTIGATEIMVTGNPAAMTVTISEENYKKTHPWDYAELVVRLKSRYSDFKQNKAFHELMRGFKQNEKLSYCRFADVDDLSSAKKWWFSPNIVTSFDGHYRRK